MQLQQWVAGLLAGLAAWGVRQIMPEIVFLALEAAVRVVKQMGLYDQWVSRMVEQLERAMPDRLDDELAQVLADVATAYADRIRARGAA